MMYIVLTAMLALNVASEVLEAFKVIDSSLVQTLEAVDMKNNQIYNSFKMALEDNPKKAKKWNVKADQVHAITDSMISYIFTLKEGLVRDSGCEPVTEENPLSEEDFYFVTEGKDTLIMKKKDDLNAPSEYLITQKRAYELKDKIVKYRKNLVSIIPGASDELKKSVLSALDTADPKAHKKEAGDKKDWETQNFLDRPLIAVLTLLTKVQIDVQNAESNVINYLFSQIDASSFKFNKLQARVIPNSSVVLQGEPYEAKVFLAAEDSTQQPIILINGKKVPVKNGQATYRGNTSEARMYSWGGIIKYKTPGGVIKDYPFEHEYQVTKPTVTMSATRMNVFYRGLDNEFEVGGGAIPNEDLEIKMTNGTYKKVGDKYMIHPTELDEQGRRTKVSVYATIGGESRLVGSSTWRVKQVPDPVAQIAEKTGGDIRKEIFEVQRGIFAVLEDFNYDYTYKVTQFTMQFPSQGGYVTSKASYSNLFTDEQKNLIKTLQPNSRVYIENIKAKGENGDVRDLDPIIFTIR